MDKTQSYQFLSQCAYSYFSLDFFSKSTCLLANRTQLVKGIIKFGINIYYVTSFDNSLALKS